MTKKCRHCATETVYITSEVLSEIESTLRPNLRTLSKLKNTIYNATYSICPCCDAYGLGMDLVVGFNIILQNGKYSNIHELGLLD